MSVAAFAQPRYSSQNAIVVSALPLPQNTKATLQSPSPSRQRTCERSRAAQVNWRLLWSFGADDGERRRLISVHLSEPASSQAAYPSFAPRRPRSLPRTPSTIATATAARQGDRSFHLAHQSKQSRPGHAIASQPSTAPTHERVPPRDDPRSPLIRPKPITTRQTHLRVVRLTYSTRSHEHRADAALC